MSIPLYSKVCVELIKLSEGFTPLPKPDPIGLSSVGYGHRIRRGESWALPISEATGMALLRSDANYAWSVVQTYVKGVLTQGQVDALTDLVYNIGEGTPGQHDGFVWLRNGHHSTMLLMINAGEFDQAADQFRLWDKAGGVVFDGLVTRRRRDAQLFRTGTWTID